VSLQQSHRSKLAGSNGDWQLQTDGEIKQASQKSIVEAQTSEQSYHERSTKVATHDINEIDGNQVNKIMGALKILVGEKAIITSLDNQFAMAEKLATAIANATVRERVKNASVTITSGSSAGIYKVD